VDSPKDTEQHATGHAAPTPIAYPRLAFEVLFVFDVAAAAGPYGQAKALGFAMPPAHPGQGKPPEERFIFIEQNDLTTLGAILQGAQCNRSPRQFSRVGSESPGRTPVADGFFLTHHGRSPG